MSNKKYKSNQDIPTRGNKRSMFFIDIVELLSNETPAIWPSRKEVFDHLFINRENMFQILIVALRPEDPKYRQIRPNVMSIFIKLNFESKVTLTSLICFLRLLFPRDQYRVEMRPNCDNKELKEDKRAIEAISETDVDLLAYGVTNAGQFSKRWLVVNISCRTMFEDDTLHTAPLNLADLDR
jgi:hypothetical protein